LANRFGHGDIYIPSKSVLDCLMLKVEVNALFGGWDPIGIGNALVYSLEWEDVEMGVSL
jgi:hypothetical protein